VNGTGGFVIRSERIDAGALLAQIAKIVSEVRRSRAQPYEVSGNVRLFVSLDHDDAVSELARPAGPVLITGTLAISVAA
jgi:hypothetical protein